MIWTGTSIAYWSGLLTPIMLMQQKQADGLKPIIEKAQKAIEDVAATKGITYVFDASMGKGLLVKKGEDLFAAVKAKLGF